MWRSRGARSLATLRRTMSSAAASGASSPTPLEDALRRKITEALAPVALEVFNDSHKHAHHQAMEGVTSKETHFRVYITSDAFQSKPQPARHRMVYGLLKDEMAAQGGIHALQLRTRTVKEEETAKTKAS